MATKKWSAARRKKFAKTMAAKKKSKTSIPLDMIPDRPARKAKVIKAMEAAWQAPPLRMDEHTTQQAKIDILFGLITLAHKVLR